MKKNIDEENADLASEALEAIGETVEENVQVADQPATFGSEEIMGLETAINKVTGRIRLHEEQIRSKYEEITKHEQAIDELRESLRKTVAPLLEQPAAQEKIAHTTKRLIMECLKKSNRPMNTKDIREYLKVHGNDVNPSVELSRLVQKQVIDKPSRGLFQIKK